MATAIGEKGRSADLVAETEDAMATEAAKYPNLKGDVLPLRPDRRGQRSRGRALRF